MPTLPFLESNVLCPIHRKDDYAICANYCDLLNVIYKIVTTYCMTYWTLSMWNWKTYHWLYLNLAPNQEKVSMRKQLNHTASLPISKQP